MIEIEMKVLDERVRAWGLPDYKTEMAAGIDLYACLNEDMVLWPQAPAEMIPTGIAVYMADPRLCAMIYPRSGLGHKKGLVLGNGTGVIDADFQAELMISAWNRDPQGCIEIAPGDRIAQLVFTPIVRPSLREVGRFDRATARGLGGFGSTGDAAE